MGEIGSASTPAQVNKYAAGAGIAQGIGGASAAANSVMQARAYGMQGQYQRRLADINAKTAQFQASDAVRRGALTAGILEKRGEQIEGRQSVIHAGGGTDVNSGTNAAIQTGTQAMSRIDQLTAENNAALEAIGYKMNAINLTAEGRMAQTAGRLQSAQSIITGGAQFARGVVGGFATYDKYHIKAPGDPFVNPPSSMSAVDEVKLPADVG